MVAGGTAYVVRDIFIFNQDNRIVPDMFTIFSHLMPEKHIPLILTFKLRRIGSPFLNESGYMTNWLTRESNCYIISPLTQSLAVRQLSASLPDF